MWAIIYWEATINECFQVIDCFLNILFFPRFFTIFFRLGNSRQLSRRSIFLNFHILISFWYQSMKVISAKVLVFRRLQSSWNSIICLALLLCLLVSCCALLRRLSITMLTRCHASVYTWMTHASIPCTCSRFLSQKFSHKYLGRAIDCSTMVILFKDA